ncbi:MAG TPA: hypothetical protein VFS96_09975, partial [Nitrolancea sp.]|nr:hypothetical protein [Nitrolancea sp.]
MGSASGEGGGFEKHIGDGQSQDPTDGLIRDLIDTGRPATFVEIQQIRKRLATAPFDPRIYGDERLMDGYWESEKIRSCCIWPNASLRA